MLVWRICKAIRAVTALDGEGARRYPGRWNHKGVAMVYAASSLSLASLEVFVHLDPDDLPDDLVSIRVRLPEEVAVETLDVTKLPKTWRSIPGPSVLKDLGSEWAKSGRTAALVVPSAVTLGENNILLNPNHPDMAKLVAESPVPFAFDSRMRK